jgi:30S ribosomal protein S31
MGRGDKRTAKGKRFKGSYGISRPHRIKTEVPAPKAVPEKKEKVKKDKETKAEKPAKKAAAKKAPKKKED